jgi:hypothetical protein
VPNGDLLGYLRKSRGQDDQYFNDPDIKPRTDITSKHLVRFAKDVACGMDFLASNKVYNLVWIKVARESVRVGKESLHESFLAAIVSWSNMQDELHET